MGTLRTSVIVIIAERIEDDLLLSIPSLATCLASGIIVLEAIQKVWDMRRNRLFPGIILLLLLIPLLVAIGCGGGEKSPTPALSPTPTQSPAPQPTTIAPPFAVINGHTFHLEIPTDEAAFYQGLGKRPSLPEDTAMLFIYPNEDYRDFWMKDMLFPLDILFLDSSRKIVDIQTMQPEPGVPDYKLRSYRSSAPAMYAIEMNAGLAEKLGFAVGMVAELYT